MSGSSLGYSMLELLRLLVQIFEVQFGEGIWYHSLQNRKVICSIFFCSSPELDSGDAIVAWFAGNGGGFLMVETLPYGICFTIDDC